MLFNKLLLSPLRYRSSLLQSRFITYQQQRHFVAKPPTRGPVLQASLMQRYLAMTGSNEIEKDQNQKLVMEWLHKYTQNLYNHEHELDAYKYEMSQMTGSQQLNPKAIDKLQQRHPELQKVRSIYLWGDPGCGKSFLME